MGIPTIPITLDPIAVPVHADRRLAFQVVTAFGAGAKDSDESSKVLERDGDRVLVEFHSPVKGLLGRTKVYKTVEWVTPHEPDRIDFEHVKGPLEVMHDHMVLDEVEGGCMTLTYSSEFAVRWWWPGWIIGVLYVRPTLRKMMTQHLLQLKDTIEERARRSHLSPNAHIRLMTNVLPNNSQDVIACCSTAYSHPAARWLLGDSFHPGSLGLTDRLAMLTAIGPDSLVLDAGSGRGTTAVHLAKTLGCRVMGITLEAEGVEAGVELARQKGVADKVSFLQGDIADARADIAAFDAAIMECVLSILPNKPAALERLHGVICPTGYLGITDITVNGPLPPELQGILAVAGCVADARSLDEYASLISDVGFNVMETTDLKDVLFATLKDIKGKLMVAEIATKLAKVSLDPELLPQAKSMLASVTELVSNGTLSYGMVVAQKPVI